MLRKSIFLVLLIFSSFQIQIHGCPIQIEGYSWEFNEDVSMVITGVGSVDLCVSKCNKELSCAGYTWQEGQQLLCVLFNKLRNLHVCENCISGSKLQRIDGGCSMGVDDILAWEDSATATDCMESCVALPECSAYTWYNQSAVIQNACYLFRSCEEVRECSFCESGRLGCFNGDNTSTSVRPTSPTVEPTHSSDASTSATEITSDDPLTTQLTTELPTESTVESTTTTSGIEPEGPCSEYKILDDSTRSTEHEYGPYCDQIDNSFISPDWQGEGWYRLLPPAGIKIPEYAPGYNHCGTNVPAWANSSHPQDLLVETEMTICFNKKDVECDHSDVIKCVNCGEYFVYYLKDVENCRNRYCASTD